MLEQAGDLAGWVFDLKNKFARIRRGAAKRRERGIFWESLNVKLCCLLRRDIFYCSEPTVGGQPTINSWIFKV